MLNNLETGYFRMDGMGQVPRVICHVFAVMAIPAVMVGFFIYKMSNWFVSMLEVK